MVDARTLEFFVGWNPTGVNFNVGYTIEFGPYGADETRVKIWSRDDKSVQHEKVIDYEISTVFKFRVSKTALDLLDNVHDDMIPIDDLNLLSMLNSEEQEAARMDAITRSRTQRVLDLIKERPGPLADLKLAMHDKSRMECSRILKWIRWRYVCDWDIRLQRHTSVYWRSKRDNGWRTIPVGPPASTMPPILGKSGVSRLPENIRKELEDALAKNDDGLVLAFDLLCEAKRIAHSLPSLSLFETCQAIEVGVKKAIVRLQPQTEWVMFNMPSPSVETLLNDYIPTLIDESKKETYTEFLKLIKESLKKTNRLRNQLTHRGTLVEADKAMEACEIGGNILFMMEFICGTDWAIYADWEKTGFGWKPKA